MGGKNSSKLCTVPGCTELHRARGYCRFHYQRWSKGVSFDLPHRYPSVSKTGWVMGGYRWISTHDAGEILEHRYLMEKHLKRKLTTDECVHHINGDPLDNRIVNLAVVMRDKHTSKHRAHRKPCVICGKDDLHGGYGLCAVHYMRVKSFLERFDICLPKSRNVLCVLYMGMAWALSNPVVAEALESLCLGRLEDLQKE